MIILTSRHGTSRPRDKPKSRVPQSHSLVSNNYFFFLAIFRISS